MMTKTRKFRIPDLLITGLLLSAGGRSPAAEIIKFTKGETSFLAVAKDQNHKVEMNQNLCVYQKKKQLACGLVIRFTEKGYILALDDIAPKAVLEAGMRIEVRKMNRSTAAQSSRLDIVKTSYEVENNYKGLLGGLALFSPFVRFEQVLLPWLNLGLMPTFLLGQSSGTGSLSGLGVFATTSVYPLEPFNQLFGIGGLGGFFATAKTDTLSESIVTAGAFLAAGWRVKFGEIGTAGVALGGQYHLLPGNSVLIGQVGGFSPYFSIDAGIIF